MADPATLSDGRLVRAAVVADRSWLRSQWLGVLCGQLTVALLAVGSFVMSHVDAAPAPRLDDVRAFFLAPSPWYLWLYLLVPVLGLYGLNTTLCTWDDVLKKWRQGRRTIAAYAPSVFHVAFLVTLLAHLVGGLWGREEAPVLVGTEWQDLGGGLEARTLGIEEEAHPDGSLAQTHVRLETREAGGAPRTEEVSFNGPLSRGLGSRLLLLADWDLRPAAQLEAGGQRCVAASGEICRLGDASLLVTSVHRRGHWGDVPVVRLQDAAGEQFFLGLGWTHDELRFTALAERPSVLLRRRHAPGNPPALFAAGLLGLSVLAMGRRWL